MLPGYGTDVLILQKEYRARKSVRRADKNKVFSGLFCAFGAVPFIMTKTAEQKVENMAVSNDRIDLYTSIVPNERQLVIQKMKYYAFVHYSVNTFTNKEWGSGKESPSVFNPKSQNTDQWCEAIAAIRSRERLVRFIHLRMRAGKVHAFEVGARQ